MIDNYIKIAVRNLVRYRFYTIINMIGLAIGLAGCLLIAGYVANELSFEAMHTNKDNIYRVQVSYGTGESALTTDSGMPALAPAMQQGIPEVVSAVRYRNLREQAVRIGQHTFKGDRFLCAAPEMLEIFTLPLSQGDPDQALTDPLTVLITREKAAKYFPGVSPVGSTITIMDSLDCRISGVLENIPHNTQLKCDFILSYSSLEVMGEDPNSWDRLGEDYVYILLQEGTSPASIAERLPALVEQNLGAEKAAKYHFSLVALKDIYLNSQFSDSRVKAYIVLFSTVAILLLLIASINFINLSTARTFHRTHEVGVRKVLGAFRSQLVRQFLVESLLITAVSMVIGLGLYEIGKPQLEGFIGRNLEISLYQNPFMLLTILAMIIFVGLFSGSYPALYLSRFRPASILSNTHSGRASKSVLRKILVVFQFVIAVVLIFSTITIHQQVGYFKSQDLGFNPENVVVLDLGDYDARTQVLKTEIQNHCPVASVTSSYGAPGESKIILKRLRTEGHSGEEAQYVFGLFNDPDYLPTFEIDLLAGRNFDEQIADDQKRSVIVNELAVKEFGLDNPVGSRLYGSGHEYEIIGVIDDFEYLPLKIQMRPTVMFYAPQEHQTLSVKVIPGNIPETLASLAAAWNRVIPEHAFEYHFLEDIIDRNYQDEVKLGTLFSIFSLLAISIASLGVFGLSAHTVENRTQEIGIRKVLGATMTNIVTLISKEFALLVALAGLIAAPIGWYFMDRWLQDFAHRTEISLWIYLAAGALALLVAMITISVQLIRAATVDPVKLLRYE